MPAPKKAVKKATGPDPEHNKPHDEKKGKKKHGEKEPKVKGLKELRRTYEHLGRVECLMPRLVAAAQKEVSTLVALAQSQLNEGHTKDAADLVRAAEHLAFAATVKPEGRQGAVAALVKEAVEQEFDHLSKRATKHWDETDDHHEELTAIYKHAHGTAKLSVAKGAYRRAMELVRAAEAMAHVEHLPSAKAAQDKLEDGKRALSLKA